MLAGQGIEGDCVFVYGYVYATCVCICAWICGWMWNMVLKTIISDIENRNPKIEIQNQNQKSQSKIRFIFSKMIFDIVKSGFEN